MTVHKAKGLEADVVFCTAGSIADSHFFARFHDRQDRPWCIWIARPAVNSKTSQ